MSMEGYVLCRARSVTLARYVKNGDYGLHPYNTLLSYFVISQGLNRRSTGVEMYGNKR